MNRVRFRTMVIDGTGRTARLNRAWSDRVCDFAVQEWPADDSYLLEPSFRSELRSEVIAKVRRRYREEVGFNPLVAVLIGQIISFLIQWYFSDRAASALVMNELKRR